MKRNIAIAALLAASATFYLPATAMAQVGVNIVIGHPPPPARYEVAPAPRRGYVWAPGYWDWSGRRYVWVQGHWEYMHPGQMYQRPAWRHDRDGWRLERGGWRAERHDDRHDRHGHHDDDRGHGHDRR